MNKRILIPFLDVLMNSFLVALTLFIIVLIDYKQPIDPTIPPKAEYLVTMEWEDDSPADIDIWLQTPTGKFVFYGQREADSVHLERDDLGLWNEVTFDGNGTPIVVLDNHEVIVFRSILLGTSLINVHYFGQREETRDCLHATVKIEKVNPYRSVFRHTFRLCRAGEQQGTIAFTVTEKGESAKIVPFRNLISEFKIKSGK